MSYEDIALRLRGRRTLWLLGFDSMAILFAFLAFGTLRYAGGVDRVWTHLLIFGAAAVVLQWSLGLVVGIYQGRTTVASLEETLLLSVLSVAGGVILSTIDVLVQPRPLSRIVPLAAAFGALFVMVLGRGFWRSIDAPKATVAHDAASTLVFGAGSAGRQLVHSMLANPSAGMRPVALLDDDPWKRRLRVAGVPVLGARSDLVAVARSTAAAVLVIAIPTAGPELIREVDVDARNAGLDVKVLPGVGELLSGRASIRDVRDINITDLLGRATIETDVESIAGYLTGKRVLVTGAGGSIGSELSRQIHRWGPAELMMLDRDESGLHEVQLSIHGQAMLDSPEVVLADIRDQATLRDLFQQRRPEVVFHAAALKHLPMLEQYPTEAAKTNVIGTLNVLTAAAEAGVERFVNISTDKAADPSSVLGYSKRVAERLTASVAAGTAGTYLSVRFGNVLGSRGSVLTAFAAQIGSGGPVTVTHPEVTRYFMTTEEAVQLVIQAAAIGRDGEALILDMGDPVRIQDVAEQLIEQSGEPIDIVYTGLRDGEKLHETLLGSDERDERPMHPLVSQVSVPALHPAFVLATPVNHDDAMMRRMMLEWCCKPSDVREDPPAFRPRAWSSIES